MRRALEDRVAAVASRQHGVVSHAQLVEAGLSPWAVGRRVRAGRLRRLHRGIYLALPFALPHTREMAAVLVSGPTALLSHASAAPFWAMQTGADAVLVDVTALDRRGSHPGIRLHHVRCLAAEDRTIKDGIPITTPARTIADLATGVAIPELERIIARAERDGLVAPGELTDVLARSVGHRGAKALRAVLGLAGGPALTRSAAEQAFLALVRDADLPRPRCNVKVGHYEVDFLWPAAALVVEVDGYRYHSSRASFEGDRRKDAELVAAGLTVLHLSWQQVTRQSLATVARLAPALARAGGGCR